MWYISPYDYLKPMGQKVLTQTEMTLPLQDSEVGSGLQLYVIPLKLLLYVSNVTGFGVQPKMPWKHAFSFVVSPSTTLQLVS